MIHINTREARRRNDRKDHNARGKKIKRQKPMDKEKQQEIQAETLCEPTRKESVSSNDSLTYFGRVAVQATAQKMVLAIRFTAIADQSV